MLCGCCCPFLLISDYNICHVVNIGFLLTLLNFCHRVKKFQIRLLDTLELLEGDHSALATILCDIVSQQRYS